MTKEIEALQDLSKLVFIYGGMQQYQIIEKSLKALEIIKEKDVHIVWLKESRTLEAYNEELEKRRMHNRLLTYEEYEILREELL